MSTAEATVARRGARSRFSLGPSLVRGLVFFALGYVFGAVVIALIRVATGNDIETEPLLVGGYPFAIVSWLMGVGMWEYWGREWIGREIAVPNATGWRRYLHFTLDHKVIGVQYLVTFVSLFLIAGLLAMTMRYELMRAGEQIVNAKTFNEIMSLHGLLMIGVAVSAVIGAFGNFAVPLMIGAEDMAFPRLNALSYWLVPPVAILLASSAFLGGWNTGWTGYPPLSETNDMGQVMYNMSFMTLGMSSILGGLNFIVTIFTMRAPGMTWTRLPIFVWGILLTSLLSVLFTQSVATALLLVLLDREVGTSFFVADRGGFPVLYQHIFWFYSHPAVYIMIIPGWALGLEVIVHFSRRSLFGYRWAVGGLIGVVAMSMAVWAHHMFTAGIPNVLHPFFLTTTELISIPTGLVFLSALGTIWNGRLWLRTPMLFALAVIFNFLFGGITGVFLADVPVDLQLQDTYFVVAHFHYVIMGGEIFGLFAGIYYWFPKITGRMYSERLAKLHFWWMFTAFNLTFFPLFWAGLHGMNRRVADYPPELEPVNTFASLMAFALGASFLVFVYNVVTSLRRGPVAEANPWHARTLEWLTSSPPPVENFPAPPVVTGDPYGYGTPSAHGTLAGAPAAAGEE